MKPHSVRFCRRILLHIVLPVVLASGVCGQTATPSVPATGVKPATTSTESTPPGLTSPEEKKPLAPFSERRFSVQFHGATLAEAMESLRTQLPDLNVVVPPSLTEVPLGPLKLRNVTMSGLVQGISAATDEQIQAAFDGDSFLTFASKPAAGPQSICRIFSLREYLADKKREEMDKAIEDLHEVVLMARDHIQHARNGVKVKPPQLSIHPATKLLIVVGSPEAVSIVEQVAIAVGGGTASPKGLSGVEDGSVFEGAVPGKPAPSGMPPAKTKRLPVPGAPPLNAPLGQKF